MISMLLSLLTAIIVLMNDTYRLNLRDLPVYVINLKEDKAKRSAIEEQLRLAGFSDVTFFPGVRSPVKKVGVATSHNLLLTQLGEKDLPCLVLEDDVSIWDKKEHIDVPHEADAYYLGNSAFGLYGGVGKKKVALERFDNNTFRIYNMLAAHAIIYLNYEYVKFLQQATGFQLMIKDNQDKARAETMKYWQVYSAEKPMFYQNGVHEPFTKRMLPGKSYGGPESVHVF
jgi:hypothetical protein